MDVALLLMVLGVMLSGFRAADALDHYDRRSFDRKEKDVAGGRNHQIVLYCGKAGDLYESERPTH